MHKIKILFIFIIMMANSTLSFSDETSPVSNESKTLLSEVHSDEIRSIMRRIRILIYDREYTELELRKLTNKQLGLLVNEIKHLTIAAKNIPNIKSLNDLDEEEQVTFSAMANQLYESVIELQHNSKTSHQQSLTDSYIKLQETCNTCHRIFRNK